MSPVLSREERDAIRARAEGGTEGTWTASVTGHVWSNPGEPVLVAQVGWVEDAEFIAHARTDVPALLDALDAAEAKDIRRADAIRDALAELRRAEAERDALAAQLDALRAECEDQRGARKVASDAANRFRDVLAECLGHDDNNPGDDVLVAEIRAHFGKTGPEPTRWRDFLTGALARLDQIRAMPDPVLRALAAAPSETEENRREVAASIKELAEGEWTIRPSEAEEGPDD